MSISYTDEVIRLRFDGGETGMHIASMDGDQMYCDCLGYISSKGKCVHVKTLSQARGMMQTVVNQLNASMIK